MIKTKGIVFRAFKYRETSLIVDIYTVELGMRSYLVNGVRSTKAKTAGNILQPMNQLDLTVYDKAGADKLNRIKEFKLEVYYKSIPFDVLRSMIGQFMVEVLKKCLRKDGANEKMYQFIKQWFDFLDNTKKSLVNIIPLFMIELSANLGFAIIDDKKETDLYFDIQEGHFEANIPGHKYYMDENQSELLFELMHVAKEDSQTIILTNKQRSLMIDQLVIFFRLHVDSFGEIKSLEILRSIMG